MSSGLNLSVVCNIDPRSEPAIRQFGNSLSAIGTMKGIISHSGMEGPGTRVDPPRSRISSAKLQSIRSYGIYLQYQPGHLLLAQCSTTMSELPASK